MVATVDYYVVIQDFANTTTFDPGPIVANINNAAGLAWTEYINDVSEAFFTIPQDDPVVAAIAPYVNRMPHMRIYRNGELVWGGWLGEMDETQDDAIIYGYSYASGLYMVHTDWDQEWIGQEADLIISDLWTRARTLTKSRLGWCATGTIQDLWTTSGGPTVLSMPLYRVFYKRILSSMKELTAYAISDTTNHVVFEITPSGTFNLWRDRRQNLNHVGFAYEHGYIRSYRRLRSPVESRNTLHGVGSSPQSLTLREDFTNTTHRDSRGRLEESIYLPWVRDAAELTRVGNLRLARAVRVDTDLIVTFSPDRLIPYRASGASYAIGDIVTVTIPRGLSTGTPEQKVIVGQQVIYYRKAENTRLLFADRL